MVDAGAVSFRYGERASFDATEAIEDAALAVAAWLTKVWRHWRGGIHLQFAYAVAEIVDPVALTFAMTDATVRRLAFRVHTMPVGTRCLLDQFLNHDLLVQLPGGASGVDTLRLAV